jgi:hypothetical protein
MKTLLIFFSGLLSGLAAVGASMLARDSNRIIKIYTLTQFLIITSDHADKALHTLPTGTTPIVQLESNPKFGDLSNA